MTMGMKTRSILVFALASACAAQHADPAVVGRDLFNRYCTSCHGAGAQGGRGPNLARGDFARGSSDAAITRNIVEGIAGTQMPGFPLPPAEVQAMVAYLRSLETAKGDDRVQGDAARGRTLFFGGAGCSGCHMMGGSGGRLGPDLTRIGADRRISELRRAIAEPSALVKPGYNTLEIVTAEGTTIRGAARNEDTFSVQLMDRAGKLHLMSKRNLREVRRVKESLMPAAAVKGQDLDDVLAFLRTPGPLALPAWTPAADFNVSFDRLRNARREPQNWLHYWGDYEGTHSTALRQINGTNIGTLRPAWSYQFTGSATPHVETTPIVAGGLMFVTGPGSDVAALDARTGRQVWRYSRPLPKVHSHCTVMTNRGVAILGDRLYLGTLDARLVALDAKTGNVIFDVEVGNYKDGLSITHAPLAIDGRIVIGITAGECALAGYVDAYDAATGKRLWRTHAVAQPGDPNHKTWAGDSWKYGGAPTWMTGTYDVSTRTIFWTTGNPGPDYDGTVRAGDNLYSCSVLALDPDTGRMKWYFQHTPHDVHDWDSNETPVLVDAEVRGRKRKLLIQANRNAFYYVLDRETGEFLAGKAFAKQTWARGLDDKGRPIVIPNTDPTPEGNYACPDAGGATNWAAPSYSQWTGLFYVSVRETCATYFRETKPPVPGEPYTGGGQRDDGSGYDPGFVRALDPATGDIRWSTPTHTGSWATGVLATAGGLVFAGVREGSLLALDDKTGKILWSYNTGGQVQSGPISYAVDGRQYVAIANTTSLTVFTLP